MGRLIRSSQDRFVYDHSDEENIDESDDNLDEEIDKYCGIQSEVMVIPSMKSGEKYGDEDAIYEKKLSNAMTNVDSNLEHLFNRTPEEFRLEKGVDFSDRLSPQVCDVASKFDVDYEIAKNNNTDDNGENNNSVEIKNTDEDIKSQDKSSQVRFIEEESNKKESERAFCIGKEDGDAEKLNGNSSIVNGDVE